MIAAMQSGLAALKDADNATAAPTITFGDLQKVVGFPDYWRRDALYRAND